jgi:glutathione peroxidase
MTLAGIFPAARRVGTPQRIFAFWIMTAVAFAAPKAGTVHQFKARTIDGKEFSLSNHRGKTLLIVNVASQCGYTPQYGGLQKLYEKYKAKGFIVLGFPCNQFGQQEPGTEAEIKKFCESKYNVTFPLFSKIDVNGPQTHPLYSYLKDGKDIGWNFTKFLVDKKGRVLQRYESKVTPEDLEKGIQKAVGLK